MMRIRCSVRKIQFGHVQFRLTFRNLFFFFGVNGLQKISLMQETHNKYVMANIIVF